MWNKNRYSSKLKKREYVIIEDPLLIRFYITETQVDRNDFVVLQIISNSDEY